MHPGYSRVDVWIWCKFHHWLLSTNIHIDPHICGQSYTTQNAFICVFIYALSRKHCEGGIWATSMHRGFICWNIVWSSIFRNTRQQYRQKPHFVTKKANEVIWKPCFSTTVPCSENIVRCAIGNHPILLSWSRKINLKLYQIFIQISLSMVTLLVVGKVNVWLFKYG